MKNNIKIGIIGLGYVGFPLLINLKKKFSVFGYDKNEEIINRNSTLKNFISNKPDNLITCNVFIITVPTPVNSKKLPDLSLIKNASKLVAKYLKHKDIVIYESTVYPGVTEDIGVPILKKFSGLSYNSSEYNFNKNSYFSCGYSPERINVGDPKHNLINTVKVISASNRLALRILKNIYGSIIKAGTFSAKSIKTAELAKVLENTQRDINIALINELSIICDKIGLNTFDVLETAKTKWNFHNYKPGLVGGHCISVDPYYLAYKAKQININPKVILSGRETNDNLHKFIKSRILNLFKKKKIKISNAKILILGASFKENCDDVRNSKIFDLVNLLSKKKSMKIDIFDPIANKKEAKILYNYDVLNKLPKRKYDCVIYSLNHKIFSKIDINKIKLLSKNPSILVDLKNKFRNNHVDLSL